MTVVLMGVSGCGKTTVGRLLALRLDWPFFDADDYHPPANVEKMRSGTSLTDEDRWPWLDRLNALLRSQFAALEEPVDAIVADVSPPVEEIAASLAARLTAAQPL